MQAMAVRWKVKEVLNTHDITPYRLVKASGLAQATIYRLVNDDTTGLSTETLSVLLGTLRELTGEELGVADLLSYEEIHEDETKAWTDASLEDLSKELADLEADVPKKDLDAWFSAFDKAGFNKTGVGKR
jgi:DNA-binding Xre family transcriptional regulator